jgi:hypothetical protein
VFAATVAIGLMTVQIWPRPLDDVGMTGRMEEVLERALRRL